MTTLQGICPILATAFHQDGSLDLESQVRLVHHALQAGAPGLGLFGNAGEGYALLPEERSAVLKTVARETGGRVPLVVGAGATGTYAAAESAREAEALGAAALMVLPPYYLKTDGDGLLRYYEAVAGAVSIPVMVQDAPLMTQVAMPAALIARMGREIPGVRYAKVEAPPTPPKVTAVLQAGGPVVFGGLNCQFLIEEVDRGARGAMPGSDLTAELVEIWNRLQAHDRSGAWALFTAILPLLRFELQPGLGVSAMKHNLVAAGVIRCSQVRHPAAALSPESLAELEFLRAWTRDAVAQAAPAQ